MLRIFSYCGPKNLLLRASLSASASSLPFPSLIFTSSSHRCFCKLANTSEYHNISELFIEDASILGDKLLDKFDVIEDSVMTDGVLEIKTTKEGTFVLNKQAPLLQLWYSSPISGPHHYDYDVETKRWLSDKDKHDLQEKMERELGKVCGNAVTFH